MIEHGKRILTAEVGGWYDCGKLDTLLETNEILLRKGAARRRDFPGVTIHDPVYIEDGVTHRAERDRAQRLHRAGAPRSRTAGFGTPSWAATRGSPACELDGALLGNGVVAEGLRGQCQRWATIPS